MQTRRELESTLRWSHLRLAIGYAILGVIYIVTSGRLVGALFPDPTRIVHYEMLKGCGFVIVSAFLMYGALSAIRRNVIAIYDARLETWNEHQKLLLELEFRVLERTADLEFVIQELEAFTYSVSHDLRRPLRAMDSRRAQLAAQNLDAESQQVVNELGNEIKNISEIIDDLLSLSRVGRDDLQRKPVGLSAMATRVLNQLQARDPDREVKVEIEPNLTVMGDESMLNLAMVNLLHNAWTYTGEQPSPVIRVRAEDDWIIIEDNGIGFDADEAAEIFKPFARLPGAKAFAGTGIGLAIVDRIVRRHGGVIKAESQPGGGACFSFRLPPDAGTPDTSTPV